MLSHAFSLSSSILCKLHQLWLILILNFKVENFLILWVLCLRKVRKKPDTKLSLHMKWIFHMSLWILSFFPTSSASEVYFNTPSSGADLHEHLPSPFLSCKSIPLFVWSGCESCKKTGLLSVCFLNSILLLVSEFSDFIWAVLAPLSHLVQDCWRLWSLFCPQLYVSLITDWQLLSLQHKHVHFKVKTCSSHRIGALSL